VISLFTNIPHNLVIKALLKRWNYINKNYNLSKEEFLNVIGVILDSSFFFTFDNQYYKQNYGTPMGPISSVITNLVMYELES